MKEIALTNEMKVELMDYIVNLDARVTSINTIKSYRNIIDRMFKLYDTLNRYNEKEMLKKWNKKTKIRAVFSKINEFFDYCDIDYNIKLTKHPRTERTIPDILNRKEVKKIMDTMQPEGSLIVSCIFNIGAGLRISELINLEWGDIGWSEWSEKKKTISVKIKNSKRGKSRMVPIPHFTTAELYKYAESIEVINNEGVPFGGIIFDFGSKNFKKDLRLLDKKQWEYEYGLHAYDFIRYNLINKHFGSIENKHITAHSLRHSRASELHNVYNIPISKIQQWLGHSDISTTMLYIHMATQKDEKIMERVGGV